MSMEDNDNIKLLNSLPMETQKGLLKDWLVRAKLGYLRGEGLASHASYIKLIADEHDCTIEDVLSLDDYPV